MLKLAASVFYHSRDGIMITALDGSILAVNKSFLDITGYDEDDVLGQNPRMLKSGRQSPEFYEAMWKAIKEQGYWQGEATNRRKDGSHFVERISIVAAPGSDGNAHHYIGVFSDITVATEQRHCLELRGNFDALTGLPNRNVLCERLAAAIARASAGDAQLAVAFIDLDGFKQVNDRLGHTMGDELLVTMARRLQRALRDSDTLARFGGDEFVAILPDVPDDTVLETLLERLLSTASTAVALAGGTVSLSASIGIAQFPFNGSTVDQLIGEADAAMYTAKRSGRNCVRHAAARSHHLSTNQKPLP